MKHTALYLRVSTEAQADEGYSLAAQAEKLEAYCRMKGISRFTRYVDGGFSGSSLNRPAVTQLIDCIRNGEVERVVVYKLDRLSRSQKDTLYLIEDVFAPHSVDFVSINENIDTGTPYGRAMIGILSAFAQLERENIFLRTRMGMVERVRQGFWPGGGKIPFGYDYDPAKGILVPNSDADTVREIYARYLSGESAGSIARALGLKYEHLVRQILDRESNTGVIVYKGERYHGRHEPLIDRETWLRAQRRLHRPNRPRAADGGKLLTGYTGAASEAGHMVIADTPDAPLCTCGRRGCLESLASATALIRMTREARRTHPESLMNTLAPTEADVNGRTVFDAAAQGDAAAKAVADTYIHHLAVGVANLINIFFPEVIGLSGGVANQGENLLKPLRAAAAPMVFGSAFAKKHTRITTCTLGYRAGVIGAALLAKQEV